MTCRATTIHFEVWHPSVGNELRFKVSNSLVVPHSKSCIGNCIVDYRLMIADAEVGLVVACTAEGVDHWLRNTV